MSASVDCESELPSDPSQFIKRTFKQPDQPPPLLKLAKGQSQNNNGLTAAKGFEELKKVLLAKPTKKEDKFSLKNKQEKQPEGCLLNYIAEEAKDTHDKNEKESSSKHSEKATKESKIPPIKKKLISKLPKPKKAVEKYRKTKEELKILLDSYYRNGGIIDDDIIGDLMQKTRMSKVQINKWMWDHKKKMEESVKAKKETYPGLLFSITNMETGADLTPSFVTVRTN